MRRKQLPAKIARVVVWLFTALAVGAIVLVLGPRAIGGALKIGQWDATVSSFSIALLLAFGIWVLPDQVQNKLLRLWDLLNLLAGEVLYVLLVVLGYMRRWRIWLASLLLLFSPLAFLSVHRALQRHTHVALVNQLLEDLAEFVNEQTIAPGEASVAADLLARHRALGPQAAIHGPHLLSLMEAISILFSEEFAEEIEHDCPTCYPTTIGKALDKMSDVPEGSSSPDAQLVVLLRAKAYIALSEQGRLVHHVFDAYEALKPLKDLIDTNPGAANTTWIVTMRSLLDNLWAGVLTMCAANYAEYVAWASATGQDTLLQEKLFQDARSSHDAAFQTGSGYTRARAANNRADLELRRLWLLDQDSRTESSKLFDPGVAAGGTMVKSPPGADRASIGALSGRPHARIERSPALHLFSHARSSGSFTGPHLRTTSRGLVLQRMFL